MMSSWGIEVAFLGYVSLASCSLAVFPVTVPMSDAITATQAIISRQGCAARSSASRPPIVVFQRVCGLDCHVLTSCDGYVVIAGTSEGTGWSGRGYAMASLLRELSIAVARESKGCFHDTLANVWHASRFGAAKETTILQNSKPPRKRPQVAEGALTNQLSQFHGGASKGQQATLHESKERTILDAVFAGKRVTVNQDGSPTRGDISSRKEYHEVMQPDLEGTEQPVVPLQHDYPYVVDNISLPSDSVALSTGSLAQVSPIGNMGSGEPVMKVSYREPQMQQPGYIQTLKGEEFQAHIALVEDLEVMYQGSSLQRSTITGKAKFTACPVPCVLTITDPRGVVENVRPNKDFLSNVEETESGNTERHLSCNTSSKVVHPGDGATPQTQCWLDALTYKCSNSLSPVPLRVYSKVKEGSTEEPSGFGLSHRRVLVIVRIVANPKLPSPLLGIKVTAKLSSLSPTADLGEKGVPELTPAQNAGWNPEYSIAWWNVPKLSAGESIELEARAQYGNNSSVSLPTYVPVQVLGYSNSANFSGALLSIAADDVLAPALSVTGRYNSRLRISYTLS
eukprot:537798_1